MTVPPVSPSSGAEELLERLHRFHSTWGMLSDARGLASSVMFDAADLISRLTAELERVTGERDRWRKSLDNANATLRKCFGDDAGTLLSRVLAAESSSRTAAEDMRERALQAIDKLYPPNTPYEKTEKAWTKHEYDGAYLAAGNIRDALGAFPTQPGGGHD